jgi:hypothetical protein
MRYPEKCHNDMIANWEAQPYFVVGGRCCHDSDNGTTASVEPTGGVKGAESDALIHRSNLLDLQRNFAVIARCFSLLFPGGNRQESRISKAMGRSLAVIIRIISGISGADGSLKSRVHLPGHAPKAASDF